MNETETKNSFVIGQKYAFATASLVMGICCFVTFLGLEKAILAIVFGWLAIRQNPVPELKEHRSWAKAGIILGIIMLVLVPTIIILNLDRVWELIDVLSKLSSGR
jgi:hypothetical protein